MIFAQVVFGLGLGAAVAGLSILVLRRLTLSDGLDTIFVVAAALLSFALPAVVGERLPGGLSGGHPDRKRQNSP